MKKNYFLLGLLVGMILLAFAACSSDSDEQTVFDASLLPGYWVALRDGKPTNGGVWFSNENYSDKGGSKLVKFWWRENPTDSMRRIETTYWEVENGRIHLWLWEGARTITHLTKDRLVISSYSYIGDETTEEEYQRLETDEEIIG